MLQKLISSLQWLVKGVTVHHGLETPDVPVRPAEPTDDEKLMLYEFLSGESMANRIMVLFLILCGITVLALIWMTVYEAALDQDIPWLLYIAAPVELVLLLGLLRVTVTRIYPGLTTFLVSDNIYMLEGRYTVSIRPPIDFIGDNTIYYSRKIKIEGSFRVDDYIYGEGFFMSRRGFLTARPDSFAFFVVAMRPGGK
ncbi:MAG TPA: hypothetical protein PK253_15915 [Spirochaetota bacterium]|nr:hypothetical protein [Spirochaetota bacterium]